MANTTRRRGVRRGKGTTPRQGASEIFLLFAVFLFRACGRCNLAAAAIHSLITIAMRTKAPLALLFFGLVAVLVGAFFKIEHWRGADVLQLLGIASALVGAGLLVVGAMRRSNNN